MDNELKKAADLALDLVGFLLTERSRLLAGQFTDEEFQELCHNTDIQCGFGAFVGGCAKFQGKLFGFSERDKIFECFEKLRNVLTDNQLDFVHSDGTTLRTELDLLKEILTNGK